MKRPFLRGLVLGAGGSGTVAVVALLRNVLIARVMGAAGFGLWQICLVALRLAGESHLGALHAMSVRAPIERGRGRPEAARDLERRSISVSLALALVAGLVGGVVLLASGGESVATAAILLGVAMVAQQAFLADGAVLRARKQFGRLALLQAGFAVVHLGGLLALLAGWYLTGALAAWAGAAVAALLLVRGVTRDPLPRPTTDGLRDVGALLGTGFAPYLVGLTFIGLLQSDRIVVASLLGKEALGIYGIALLGGSVLLFVPDVVSGVLWPFAGEAYGRAGEQGAALAPVVRRIVRTLAPVLAAVLVLAVQATEVLIAWELPNYAPALEPLRPYLAGVFLLSLAMPLRLLLVTVGAGRSVLRGQVLILVGALAGQIAVLEFGMGLAGVAWVMTFAGVGLLVTMLVLSVRHLQLEFRVGAQLVVEALLVLGVALACDRMLEGYAAQAVTLEGAAVRLVTPLVLAVAAVLVPLAIEDRGNGASPPAPDDGE